MILIDFIFNMWCQKKKKVKFFSDGSKENMLVRAQEVLIFAKNKYLLAPPGALKVGLSRYP